MRGRRQLRSHARALTDGAYRPAGARRPRWSKAPLALSLGLAFRQKGYYVEALREYRLALEAGEDARLVRQAMAEVHLLRRDLAAALELYDGLLADDSGSPKLWNERGICLHQSGRRDEAAAAYEHAIGADAGYLGTTWVFSVPNSTTIWPGGVPWALRLRPDLAAARLNLALALFHRRRLQLALEAYRQVLAERGKRWRGTSAWCWSSSAVRDARRHSPAVEADPPMPRPLQPELHPQPPGRLGGALRPQAGAELSHTSPKYSRPSISVRESGDRGGVVSPTSPPGRRRVQLTNDC
jgi:tetratricopeptide (TPR) repeat protein